MTKFKYIQIILLASFFIILSGCSKNIQPEIILSVKSEDKIEFKMDVRDVLDEINIPILVYHHIREIEPSFSNYQKEYSISPKILRQQFQYLKDNNYTTLTVSDINSYFEGKIDLPSKPVILTFDDGRNNQYQNAFPLLKEFNFKATFFIFTNAINRDGYLTSDQIKELSENNMEIGSHTIYHHFLTKITDFDELNIELQESKKKLESIIDKEVLSIAYPFGMVNQGVKELVLKNGYILGRGLTHRQNISKENILSLGGYIVLDDLKYFENILSGNNL